jgi:hypoxanthine phosphoribosyltransferase
MSLNKIKILDKEFVPMISKADLEHRIEEIAKQISVDYAGKDLLIVPILNGSALFAAELMKRITIPCKFSFVKISTYHKTASTGKFSQQIGLTEEIDGKHILVIEDIVDTGFTMGQFIHFLRDNNPASAEICTLLHKPKPSNSSVSIKYTGFSIEDKFVVGFGLDYDGYGRNLPEVYVLSE